MSYFTPCPYCGHMIEPGEKGTIKVNNTFCTHAHIACLEAAQQGVQRTAEWSCVHCLGRNSGDKDFCGHCGTAAADANRWAALKGSTNDPHRPAQWRKRKRSSKGC